VGCSSLQPLPVGSDLAHDRVQGEWRWLLCWSVALILEEIAIDSHHADTEACLLDEALDLHLSSLTLAMRAFGENNVQTAKHYGNLGRLYQSMHKFAVSVSQHCTHTAHCDHTLITRGKVLS